jgi:pyridoxal phosphate enzyme (YggS family)
MADGPPGARNAGDEQRRGELATRLAAVRARIDAACAAAGRDPHGVQLIAVTKTYPASDVCALLGLGVRDIGESRDQEARGKVAETAELLAARPAPGSARATLEPPRWHLVGRLQTNKARHVVTYAHAVHSVDRPELASALADASARRRRATPLTVFVQVSLDGDPHRGGITADGVAGLAATVVDRPELALAGVMAVAPMGADPDREFAALQAISDRLRAEYPDARAISAGMSEDLEPAVRHGATHVRVGSALLGRRPPVIS